MRIVVTVAVVALDAQPAHLAMSDRLFLADHRRRCSRCSRRRHTRCSPLQLVVVDRHAPAVGLLGIGVVLAFEFEGRAFEMMPSLGMIACLAVSVADFSGMRIRLVVLGHGPVRAPVRAVCQLVERDLGCQAALTLVVGPLRLSARRRKLPGLRQARRSSESQACAPDSSTTEGSIAITFAPRATPG